MEESSSLNDDNDAGEMFNRMIRFMDVKFHITIELGSTNMKIRDVIDLEPGSIVPLDKSAGEAIEIIANGKIIAKGEVIVLEDNFGVRITDILRKE